MTAPMSLQPSWWQIFILIQLTSQFFPNVCLWRRSLCSDLVLTLKNCIEPPSYARTAYVFAIWPSFLFDSFAKIWATCEIFLGKWFTAPPPWQKISRTPMVTVPTWVAHSFQKHTQSFHTVSNTVLCWQWKVGGNCSASARRGRSAFSMWNSALHSAESMLSRLNGSYC